MLTPVYTKQFEKDLKRTTKRGKNIDKFKIIAKTLITEEPLDPIPLVVVSVILSLIGFSFTRCYQPKLSLSVWARTQTYSKNKYTTRHCSRQAAECNR
jgi:hypothetical protein